MPPRDPCTFAVNVEGRLIRLISCVGIVLVSSISACADDEAGLPIAPKSPIAIAKLDPKLDGKEVTVRLTVSELGGVAQLSIPGVAPIFVIEATSEHKGRDLTVWIEGDLAEVLERLQLSFYGSNPISKGTIIVATGALTFSPGTDNRKGHEWYTLKVDKWQNFRIVPTNRKD